MKTPDTQTTDFLAVLDKTPEAEQFALLRQWMDKYPNALFKVLRAQRPVVVTPEAVLVTHLHDCIDILNQPKVYTVNLYKPKMDGYMMAYDDDALHTREKSIMQGFLNRDDLPYIRELIGRIASEIIQTADGQFEAINHYCRLVPATLVQEYFGLTHIDTKQLIEWSYWSQANTFYNQPFDGLSKEKSDSIRQQHDRSSEQLGAYIKELIPTLLKEIQTEDSVTEKTKTTIVKRMLKTQFDPLVDFDLSRVAVNAGGLLIGSIETTSQATAQVIQYFLTHPKLHQQAYEAARLPQTQGFDEMVWEALRFVPISPYLFRQTAQTTVIGRGTDHAVMVPKDRNILIATQSAMFDEHTYDQPEQFLPGRDLYHNYTFGYGEHRCLGWYIGAEMIPEMVRQLLLQPELKAPAPIDYEGGHLPQNYPLQW